MTSKSFPKFLFIALGAVAVLVLVVLIFSVSPTPKVEVTKPAVPFSIKKEENFNAGILVRKNFRVVMSSKATGQEVKSVIDYIIGETINHDKNIDEISVVVYDREEDINGAYTLAKGDWAFNGQWGSTSQDAGQNNDRTGYKIGYDLSQFQNSESKDKPTDREMEIYNYYWDILNEPGNPSGETIHPLWLKDANPWERERMTKVFKKYNLTNDQMADIVAKVIGWRTQ